MNKLVLILGFLALTASAASLDTYTRDLLLDLHNVERAYVGIKNLTWSSSLETTAQEWAEYLATNNKFSHSGEAVGENLAMASIRSNVVAYMFSLWSGEKSSFSNAKPYPDVSTDGGAVGHYTQLIWGATYEVGCGVANTTSYSYLVCQYLLAGNYIGNYVYKASDVIYTPTSETASSGSSSSNSTTTTNSTSTSSGSSTTNNSTSSGSSTNSGSSSSNNSTSTNTGSNPGSKNSTSPSTGSSSNNNNGKNTTIPTKDNNKKNNNKKRNTRGASYGKK